MRGNDWNDNSGVQCRDEVALDIKKVGVSLLGRSVSVFVKRKLAH